MFKFGKIIALIFLGAFLAVDSFALYNGAGANNRPSPLVPPTRLIVKFRAGSLPKTMAMKAGVIATGIPELDKLSQKFEVTDIEPFISSRHANPSVEKFREVMIMHAKPGADLEAMKAEYEMLPSVEYAEPDRLAQFYGESPNDALYRQQWGLKNTGQLHYTVVRHDGPYNDYLDSTFGIPGADIAADTVFRTPPDNTVTVVVAIIDTGLDMKHPDIEANVWTNPREIPNNGIDDDNNGYVDDVHGWDFCGGGTFGSIEDNDPTDEYGHGTHVAGIVAAVTNNFIGVAGVNPACKIMPLKIDPWPLTSKIAGAIIYAANNGADVINMSFGMTFRAHLIEDALDYARAKGVVLCAASGNDFTEQLNYPAGYASTMAIGATTDSDQVAPFSTYGDHIVVCAPGHEILSLRAANTDMYGADYPQEPRVHIIDSIYYLASGTSMACPHVVGVASYLRAVSPGLTPDAVMRVLEQTADDILDPYAVGWSLPGPDKYSGYGRVNLQKALMAAPQVRAAIMSPAPNKTLSGVVSVEGIADGAQFTDYVVEYGVGSNPLVWTAINSSAIPVTAGQLASWNTVGLSGPYTVRLRAGSDNISSVSVFVANESAVSIDSPSASDTATNSVTVSGSAYCPDFSHLLLEYGAGTAPATWDTIASISTPILSNSIAGWFVDDLPAGLYTLRLSVYSGAGLQGRDSVTLYSQSLFTSGHAWKAALGGIASIFPTYGDFDNDGQDEILVGTSQGISAFNLDGTPKTSGLPAFPSNNFAIPIAVGNLDGDSIDDFVAVGYNPPMVYGFPSSGSEFRNYLGILPGISSSLYTEHELPRVSLEDVNHDGRDEIHVFIYNGDMSRTFVYYPDGTLMREFNHYSNYIAADLDEDKSDEFYVCTENYGFLKKFNLNDSTASDSLFIQMNGSAFHCYDLSACDIDEDGKLELIVYGYYDEYGYQLYAFDEGLQPVPGWPHGLSADDFVVPTTPVFGDIDGDGRPEYFTTYFDLNASYILAWKIDGTPFIPENASGFFATVPQASVLNMLILADVNGDDYPEVVACAINDIFFTYPVQRVYAWNRHGEMLSGFPIVSEMGITTYLRYTPVLGDMNKDGIAEMMLTNADSSLIFVNFPGASYKTCKAPAPYWRYSRKMNNIGGIVDSCEPTDAPENTDDGLPVSFALTQNYPNPFNSATIIDYTLPTRSHVSVTIYDILGRKVRTLVNEDKAAGRYSARWDGYDGGKHSVASGVYFYRIQAGEFSQSRKMVLMK